MTHRISLQFAPDRGPRFLKVYCRSCGIHLGMGVEADDHLGEGCALVIATSEDNLAP